MRGLTVLMFVLALGGLLTPTAMAAPRALAHADGLLTAPQRGDAESVAWRWLQQNKADFGLDQDDLSALKLSERSRLAGGATHLEWTQTVRGIEAINASVRINVARDGRIINAGGDPIPDLSLTTSRAKLSAGSALRIAQRAAGVPAGRPSPIDDAELFAVADQGADRLAWRVVVAGREPRVYSTVVDATSGKIISQHLLTRSADASVFGNHPGAAAGGTQTTVPLGGWLTAPDRLSGPNAFVFADLNDEPDFGELGFNTAGPGENIAPSSAPDYLYAQTAVTPGAGQSCPSAFAAPCTWSGFNDSTRATNRNQRGQQLFYFVNTFHDWLATEVGFGAGNGNFEGADPVIAQIDDGDAATCNHLNNANMTTLGDGVSPLMQMYFFADDCGDDSPAVSSADDASVVYHEYTHGLSNRLIGGGFGLSDNQSGAMGEGWSDWYAMDHLADAVNGPLETDTAVAGQLAIGKYVTNNATRGIRSDPIDCPVGSTGSCDGSSSAPGGGYTYADLGRVSTSSTSVHANGEIWAQTLWDLRGALGPAVARDRITEAMRLSPTIEPSFLDMRNAIISAEAVAGGANINAIWAVFAARGMGCSARSPTADSTLTVTAAFDLPTPGLSCPRPPVVPSPPLPAGKPSFSNTLKTTRLDKKGRFKFRFSAGPAGTKGTAGFKTASKIKSGRSKARILSIAARSFTIPAGGVVELQLRASASTFKKLRYKRKVASKVTVNIGGTVFTTTLTLKR